MFNVESTGLLDAVQICIDAGVVGGAERPCANNPGLFFYSGALETLSLCFDVLSREHVRRPAGHYHYRPFSSKRRIFKTEGDRGGMVKTYGGYVTRAEKIYIFVYFSSPYFSRLYRIPRLLRYANLALHRCMMLPPAEVLLTPSEKMNLRKKMSRGR